MPAPSIPALFRRENRSIRVFVSSTFRDMAEDRNELMTQCWPALRKFCAERQVEFSEVDLRWGISEEQSTRKETLKLCLDEIRACRPFFIGLLGERYGWIPGDDAFSADLVQEQPWLKDIYGKSVTELEILHGVLNDPGMAGHAFFYFRDPAYAQEKGNDFLSENIESEKKQIALKELIRKTCRENGIPLHENYPGPRELASLALEQLKAAVENQFPIEEIPDPLDREVFDHEAFAEIRRRTYIGRPDYFRALDNHCLGDGLPLLLLGDSGSGKSALFANWVSLWRKEHPKDFIFQHYTGGTADSSSHWKLMARLMKEIKRWTEDPEELPKTNDDMLRDFSLWLAKARINAENAGVRFIVVLDALNQLDDTEHGRLLGWLPENPFSGPLRLMVSTLPGDTLEAIEKRNWQTLRVQPLTPDERRRMIVDYLQRFGKQLDEPRLDRLSSAPPAANPLYLKILLDELRVTGTHEKLDERLSEYLEAQDIPSLLQKVLSRYQKDYERDRPGLVGDVLALIWAARRGLSENELMQLLKPGDLPRLPLAVWAPLRAALEEGLAERDGILNFAHDFLRTAVEIAFLPDLDRQDDYRIKLADFFETHHQGIRTCDELPWLLKKTELFERLRKCLLNIYNFLVICERNTDELRQYWVDLGEEKQVGRPYLDSFIAWTEDPKVDDKLASFVAGQLGNFLRDEFSIYQEAESLMEWGLKIDEKIYDPNHPMLAVRLNNLALLLQDTNKLEKAEPIMRRALEIDEKNFGPDHPSVARDLNNLAMLLKEVNRLKEAEPLMERALNIDEKSYGPDHLTVAIRLNNLAQLLKAENRLKEAEPLMKRALEIHELCLGPDHPEVGADLNNLAMLLKAENRPEEAEHFMRRALDINEKCYDRDHPVVAIQLNNLATLLYDTGQLKEAGQMSQRAMEIIIRFSQSADYQHPYLRPILTNYVNLLKEMGWSENQVRDQLRKMGLNF